MSTKKSAPHNNKGVSNNSMPYKPGPREAFGSPKQPSAGGLSSVDGKNPEVGTCGHSE